MHELSIPADARTAILAWYDARGRSLVFRGNRDPYAILVSEVMAQQTQVARVEPAWRAFLEAFPTVERLADAPTADVVRAWRGLGYNRRALNLQLAARAIVAQHDGRVPGNLDALQRLPGIGPYTARAVAALAFGMPVGPVDTNVRRVMRRMVGDVRLPGRQLQELADAAVPPGRPADWTHAVMDLGATVCRPAAPRCEGCPARQWCRSAAGAFVRTPRRRRTPFSATGRWLRGRIVDRLRDAGDGAWVTVAGPIGEHDASAVEAALRAMGSEGLLERHPADPAQVRLPQG
jgi:A/G-specific adenine glycosylase